MPHVNLPAVSLTGGDDTDTLIGTEARTTDRPVIVEGLNGTVDGGQLSQKSGFEIYDMGTNSGADIVATGAGNDPIYAGWAMTS